MHEEILSKKQVDLLPLVDKFSNRFGLVGGTAIALQIGHRRSIDFDLATSGEIGHNKITQAIRGFCPIQSTLVNEKNELTVVIKSVKFTFFRFPFEIGFTQKFASHINMPNLPTLASMKSYTLGRRAKWKDYVDLYFVLQKYSLSDIVAKSKTIFGGEFSEKLFREQLSYYKDVDYTERVNFLPGKSVSDSKIKKFLTDISLQKT